MAGGSSTRGIRHVSVQLLKGSITEEVLNDFADDFPLVFPRASMTAVNFACTADSGVSRLWLYNFIIFGSFWRSSLFSLICLFSVKTVQNSENSQYPNASKCFQIAKRVIWGLPESCPCRFERFRIWPFPTVRSVGKAGSAFGGRTFCQLAPQKEDHQSAILIIVFLGVPNP